MKVTVRRIQTGVAAASTLLAAAGGATLGCADEAAPDGAYDTGDQAINPGSAELELSLGLPGSMNLSLVNSTTDEFVRTGETLRFSLPAWLLWETIHPSDPLPDDARLQQLTATIKVSFVDKTTTLSTKTVTITGWSGTLYGLYAHTAQFTVPAKTDTLKLTLTIKDTADPTASASLGQTQISQIPVFGGDLPNKSLLFDNNAGVLRQRVVDGDLLVKGSTMTLGFTDWRADQIIDKLSLNTQIGTALYSSRFGLTEAPIYGTLQYEVSYSISFDGGQTFGAETLLTANTASRLVGAGRTDYEGTAPIPAAATALAMYAHVKAFLIADYSKYSNVQQKWYADNQQVFLKEAYDNPNGAFTNYTFQLQ